MLLVVDIGNTQTVIGIYESCEGEEALHDWRIATIKDATKDDMVVKLFSLMEHAGIDAECIDKAAYSTVVPILGDVWRQLILDMFGVEAISCNAKSASEAGLFVADYPNPDEIGADRVADAIAMRALYPCPAIVVDFGTATNMEVLDASGVFIGGAIAPGIITSATALFSHATRLAATDLSVVGGAIGKSTEEAIQSGIIFGEAARVDGLLRRIIDEAGFHDDRGNPCCTVVATGGLAQYVAEHSELITEVRPDLTILGLRLLAEKKSA